MVTDRTTKMLLIALFLVIFGSKAFFISIYGSPVPFWDQWDGEAALIYLPFVDGTLTPTSFIRSHNEHRILISRIIMIGLLIVSGEWNPPLQMIVNAFVHSTAVVVLIALLITGLSPRSRVALALIASLTFSLPLGWENLLVGFQLPFYLIVLCSTVSLALFISSPAFSKAWWGGAIFATTAYFSLALGCFVFLIASAAIVAQLLLKQRSGGAEWWSATVLLIAGMICIAFVTRIPHHEPLQAHHIIGFLVPLSTFIAFPFASLISDDLIAGKICLAAITLVPFALLAINIVKGQRSFSEWFVMSLFACVFLQCASLSFGRSQGYAASRYIDIALPLIPLSFAALRLIKAQKIIRLGWAIAVAGCLVAFAWQTTRPQLDDRLIWTNAQLLNTKAFLGSGDIATLKNKPSMHIPYGEPERLAMLLSDPTIRTFLPRELRPSDATIEVNRLSAFPHTALYAAVFFVEALILKSGAVIFGFGVLLMLLTGWRVAALALR